ncbi:MAG: hypothetical protein LBU09_02305 [Endomicrobium sp.]|nr:hypothetical protein [Endomicrobium sp.]
MGKKSLGKRYERLTREAKDCFEEVTQLTVKFDRAQKRGDTKRAIHIMDELSKAERLRRTLIKEKREIEKTLKTVS